MEEELFFEKDGELFGYPEPDFDPGDDYPPGPHRASGSTDEGVLLACGLVGVTQGEEVEG